MPTKAKTKTSPANNGLAQEQARQADLTNRADVEALLTQCRAEMEQAKARLNFLAGQEQIFVALLEVLPISQNERKL